MDANRYFEQMHQVMSAQKRDFSLILSVKVQDLGGADAYIELRRNASGRARVFGNGQKTKLCTDSLTRRAHLRERIQHWSAYFHGHNRCAACRDRAAAYRLR